MYEFISNMNVSGLVFEDLSSINNDIVKNEPMLFSCEYNVAMALGGPLTKQFLTKLSNYWNEDDSKIIVDSRVHMLMPGWYPAIPGFHLDDVPRELPNGQPNHMHPSYEARHCMMLINGDISPTEFALGRVILPEVGENEVYYRVWHPIIEQMLQNGAMTRKSAPSNRLLFFDWQTFHQATVAKTNGWRFFIRASLYSKRKPTNELRRQVQVYVPEPFNGW